MSDRSITDLIDRIVIAKNSVKSINIEPDISSMKGPAYDNGLKNLISDNKFLNKIKIEYMEKVISEDKEHNIHNYITNLSGGFNTFLTFKTENQSYKPDTFKTFRDFNMHFSQDSDPVYIRASLEDNELSNLIKINSVYKDSILSQGKYGSYGEDYPEFNIVSFEIDGENKKLIDDLYNDLKKIYN